MTSPLRPSVNRAFYDFSVRFEAAIRHLYPDKYRYVTCAVGYLCDSPAAARKLPLKWPDGRFATGDEIEAEWRAVKANEAAATNGAGWLRESGGVRLFLDEQDMRSLTASRLAAMVADLARRLPGFASLPASAQLALVSMCWALGVVGLFKEFPKFLAAIGRRDFIAAAAECDIDGSDNRGVLPRNEANRALLLAAAHQQATGADPSVLLMAPPSSTPPPPAPPDLTTMRGVQEALARLGHSPGPIDGKPGPRTTAATKAFQQARGLVIDGVAGPQTRAALKAALSEK